MRPFDSIESYVTLVCDQMRWKKARGRVAQELENHLIDQRDALLAQGLDEATATAQAIAETGDAIALGTQFDRAHRPKPQWWGLAAVGIILVLSYYIKVTVFAQDMLGNSTRDLLLFTSLGLGVMTAIYLVDFTLIGKYPKTFFFVSIFAFSLIILYSPNFSRSYSNSFPDCVALLFPLPLAALIFTMRGKRYHGLLLCQLAFVLCSLLLLIISGQGATFHYAAAGLVLFAVALIQNWFGIKRAHGPLLALLLLAVLAGIFLLNAWGYLSYGFASVSFNFTESVGPSLREMLARAKFIGGVELPFQMIGSRPTVVVFWLLWLILRFGWITLFPVLGAFVFLSYKGFRLCYKQKSGLGRFISLAAMMALVVQVAVYIAVNLGLTYISHISLPLLSYGNAALVTNLGLIGVLLSVFRTGHVVRETRAPSPT